MAKTKVYRRIIGDKYSSAYLIKGIEDKYSSYKEEYLEIPDEIIKNLKYIKTVIVDAFKSENRKINYYLGYDYVQNELIIGGISYTRVDRRVFYRLGNNGPKYGIKCKITRRCLKDSNFILFDKVGNFINV